jgi:hypothetical protein
MTPKRYMSRCVGQSPFDGAMLAKSTRQATCLLTWAMTADDLAYIADSMLYLSRCDRLIEFGGFI